MPVRAAAAGIVAFPALSVVAKIKTVRRVGQAKCLMTKPTRRFICFPPETGRRFVGRLALRGSPRLGRWLQGILGAGDALLVVLVDAREERTPSAVGPIAGRTVRGRSTYGASVRRVGAPESTTARRSQPAHRCDEAGVFRTTLSLLAVTARAGDQVDEAQTWLAETGDWLDAHRPASA